MRLTFDGNGNLPAGIHSLSWEEVVYNFGYNICRSNLLVGLRKLILELKASGCKCIYLDGSFVTSKPFPNDFDCCWDTDGVNTSLLNSVLTTFPVNWKKKQHLVYGGDIFPASVAERRSGQPFLDFFQTDKEMGEPKGIVKINLEDVR